MQRLEFLGDAVLDTVITLHLIQEAANKAKSDAAEVGALSCMSVRAAPGPSKASCGRQLVDHRGTSAFGDAPM